MEPNDEDCSDPITRYGMVESRQRLEEAGFHPGVTNRSLQELETELLAHLKKKINRPSRTVYLARQRQKLAPQKTVQRGRCGRLHSGDDRRCRGAIRSFGPLTKGPWYCTESLDKIVSDAESKAVISGNVTARRKDELTMESMINHNQLGPKILNRVFAHGHKAVMNLALTSSKMFKLISNSVNRWDFSSSLYKAKSPSNVFVAMVPAQSTREFRDVLSKFSVPVGSAEWMEARQRLESQGDPDGQKLRAIEVEHELFQMAKKFRRQCFRSLGPYWATAVTEIDPRTKRNARKWWDGNDEAMNIMGSLKPLKKMWTANQFEGTGNRWYQVPLSIAMEALLKLMTEMHAVSTYIEVLHLHDLPLLDRRTLAIMLRSMPRVVQVAVYKCPLVHFGDLIPILDLIHEINTGRREKEMPTIKAFDFYPHFEEGMPYKHQYAATFGLTWGPLPMDLAQRGLYCILLKALMKAKAMNLGQLFDKDGALMEWLARVPNVPLGPYCFLDAAYRYLEVDDQDPDQTDKRTQATYDLLKPVRIALGAYLGQDWPAYYIRQMGEKYFCSSCGYVTFREFFPSRAGRLPRHRRTCCACYLQRTLDEENDHGKPWRLDMLDIVCPEWKRQEFNVDAPLYDKGAGLMRLQSTETERDPNLPPTAQPLIRDNKYPFDSLAGLPSLEKVAQGSDMARLWKDAVALGFRYDLQRRGILELRHSYNRQSNGVPAFPPTREDGGAPDHEDELQLANTDWPFPFYDHRQALDVADLMKSSDW
ncbi:hypothetical protein J3F83DRAFT_712162 [Trichoderma novae-zelandiae]